jgi:hypothetical protein
MKPRTRLFVETLEDRCVPAIFVSLDGNGDLIGVFGNLDTEPGSLLLDFNAPDVVEVFENGSSLGEYDVPGDLSITLGNSVLTAPSVTVQFDGFGMSGSLSMVLGNALNGYTINIDDADGGFISGNLNITTGTGPDVVNLANDNDVFGNMTVNLGNNSDTLRIENGSDISGTLKATKVNTLDLNSFGVSPVLIEGSVILNAAQEQPFINDYDIGELVTIRGSLSITTGRSFLDNVDILGVVLGNVTARLGNGSNNITLQSTSVVNGNVYITGGFQDDAVVFTDGGVILGNVSVNLSNGANAFDFQDGFTIAGSFLTYVGGNNVDTVDFSGQAGGARLTAYLRSGNDAATLGANLSLASAFIDFGFGFDSLTQFLPAIVFPTTLRNLP